MDFGEILLLILSCVLINHMDMVSAIEKILKHRLPILNCVKCLTFWTVLIYLLVNGHSIIVSPAVSFLSSYIAIWLELLFGLIDKCYEKIFKTLYKETD